MFYTQSNSIQYQLNDYLPALFFLSDGERPLFSSCHVLLSGCVVILLHGCVVVVIGRFVFVCVRMFPGAGA